MTEGQSEHELKEQTARAVLILQNELRDAMGKVERASKIADALADKYPLDTAEEETV